MIFCIFRSAPDALFTKLATPALLAIAWTVHFSPSMRPTLNYAPTIVFGIFKSCCNFLVWMWHVLIALLILGYSNYVPSSCQVTTKMQLKLISL